MLEKIRDYLRRFFCNPEPPTVSESVPEVAPSKEERTPEVLQSRRDSDLSAEAQLAYFMDRYLYANFPTGSAFSTIRRVRNKEEQLSGIDVEFVGTDGRVYYVDEKAQLYYLNKDLPTFAFELLFKRGPYDTIGWLCNPTLKTDLYMLIWPFATQSSCKGITWDQFTKADCLLIQKQKILKMLANKGLTVERMQADAKDIRKSRQTGKIPISGLKGIYYYSSNPNQYREAPINIVISKAILMDLAQRRYIVTPENIITQ